MAMQKIMFNDKYGLTQAVLNGRKTMTRRIIETKTDAEGNIIFPAPKYKIGEVIAIAQSYSTIEKECGAEKIPSHITENSPGYRNKMFVSAGNMPHHIKITGIKRERLQDISEEDCLREGVFEGEFESYATGHIKPCYFIAWPLTVKKQYFMAPREAFACLIDKVSGKGTWESNAYVYAYEFEIIKYVSDGEYATNNNLQSAADYERKVAELAIAMIKDGQELV